MKIVQWLTNKTPNEINRKKISHSDIIQDSNIFNRLRNPIELKGIKKLVDSKCYSYLASEVSRLDKTIWGCAKCKKNLAGEQIQCSGCLDWYHEKCATNLKGKIVEPFFCVDC